MNILLRYPGYPMSPAMANWRGHGAKWAWWAIYDIMQKLGHRVTPHTWTQPVGEGRYDAVYSIQHLSGLERLEGDPILIIRLTTTDPFEHNKMINRRLDEVNKRRNACLVARRLLNIENHHYDSIERANLVILNGNDYIRNTYPQEYWNKIKTLNTAVGNINERVDMRTTIPKKRAWLWHAGSGAVHKGLDLCLEAFAKHPDWTLHVTGNLRDEPDFMQEYSFEFNLPNIHYHGWTLVDSPQFKAIVDECVGFILPTCSEGQSPAAATCLTLGLYPIISRASGVDLPDGCGLYLDELTVKDVESKCLYVYNMDNAELLEQVQQLQADALVRYSRETFRRNMTELLKEALGA